MSVKILMPAMSPTMTEGKLVKWLKSEGDEVVSGDIIAEIETDKATMEVESIDDGVIGKILVAEGTDKVPVNDIIAVLLEDGEDENAIDAALSSDNSLVVDKSEPADQENKKEESKMPEETTALTASNIINNDKNRIIVSPLAKRIAKEKGIDLTTIKGSGPRGRIVKADIMGVSSNGKIAANNISPVTASNVVSNSPDAAALASMLDMPHHLEENSGMRKTVASRLLESKQTVPHYYLTIDCELDKLLAVRKEINDAADGEYKLSVNDFILKASAMALKKVPEANVAWTDNAMVVYDRVDVSVAVAIDGGLITPIVKDADNKSLKVISAEVKDLAARAKTGSLNPMEYQGGTFSLSNLGMFGVKSFNAIINPPQAAILAVGAGEQRAIVKNNELAVATVMTVTASFDHRAIDGAVGATFLAAFKSYLESPITMLA